MPKAPLQIDWQLEPTSEVEKDLARPIITVVKEFLFRMTEVRDR